MERLVSSWSGNTNTLPESYILPPGERPGSSSVSPCRIPVIDLSAAFNRDHNKARDHARTHVIEQILQACKQYGFFQVINHGVPKELMAGAMKVFTEFFKLPQEDKAVYYHSNPVMIPPRAENTLRSEDLNKVCRLYTSSYKYAREGTHYWRDCLQHECTSLKDSIPYWPNKPPTYKDVVGAYSAQLRDLGSRIINLISEGLGLEPRYMENGLGSDSFLVVNHYPPCPNPDLTLGLPKHCDPNLITILLQGEVPGLQVLIDGRWFLVEPCPNALVVNMGYQFEVISNGRLKSAEHRAVTNESSPRTTAGYFIRPSSDCIVGPASDLIRLNDPPRYRPFQYSEFISTFVGYGADGQCAMEHYTLNH